MSNPETSLIQLGEKARHEHARVAQSSDLDLAGRRFVQAAREPASRRLASPPRWLLFAAAALGTGLAVAAAGSLSHLRSGAVAQPSAPARQPAAALPNPPAAAVKAVTDDPPVALLPRVVGSGDPALKNGAEARPSVAPTEPPLSSLAPVAQHDRLLALRSAPPGTPGRSAAAFRLGRLYADLLGNPREAAVWFGTYLAEQPRGALRGDAQGRMLECLGRSGQKAAAKTQAQRYLADYPGGPYAAQAQRILGQ